MSDQSIYLVSKHCRRMLGRHGSSSRGNLKMNLHIGGFFARFLILAQQYTSAKTQPIPSKFGLFTFLLRQLSWTANLKRLSVLGITSFCTFSFQQKFNLFSVLKQTNKSAQFVICLLSCTKGCFFLHDISSVLEGNYIVADAVLRAYFFCVTVFFLKSEVSTKKMEKLSWNGMMRV